VTFVETGYAGGQNWLVSMNLTTLPTTTNSVTFPDVPAGTYTYSVGTPSTTFAFPDSGTVVVNGDTTIQLVFGPATSNNLWAGFVSQSPPSPYSTVISTRLNVPTVTCDTKGKVSFWLGYDGYGGNDVIQEGLEADCRKLGSTPHFSLWHEFYESCQIACLHNPTFQWHAIPVRPGYELSSGDSIDLDIAIIKGEKLGPSYYTNDFAQFTISSYNSSGIRLGKTWSHTYEEPTFYAPKYNEAECIAESPNHGKQAIPEFSTVTFTSCSPNDQAAPSNLLQLSIVKPCSIVKTAADILTSGVERNSNGENSFTVSWQSAYGCD